MKYLRINKHRYGFNIQFTHHICFDMDYNEWRFIPSIEFYRRPGSVIIFKLAFLCFQLIIHKWRFDNAK